MGRRQRPWGWRSRHSRGGGRCPNCGPGVPAVTPLVSRLVSRRVCPAFSCSPQCHKVVCRINSRRPGCIACHRNSKRCGEATGSRNSATQAVTRRTRVATKGGLVRYPTKLWAPRRGSIAIGLGHDDSTVLPPPRSVLQAVSGARAACRSGFRRTPPPMFSMSIWADLPCCRDLCRIVHCTRRSASILATCPA